MKSLKWYRKKYGIINSKDSQNYTVDDGYFGFIQTPEMEENIENILSRFKYNVDILANWKSPYRLIDFYRNFCSIF